MSNTQQELLTNELIIASEKYYTGEDSGMSDIEFDRKVEQLRQMEKESGTILPGSPTQNVGAADKMDNLPKARHEKPALSLDKVKYKDRENLIKWLSNEKAVISWKCDGSTVILTYDDGSLVQAVTRGNGEEGSVITHNAKFFKGVPQEIGYKGHLVVRGEAMMTNAEFERVNTENDGVYENARNLATATIQMLDANESRKREIIFKVFELVCPDTETLIGDKAAFDAWHDYADIDYDLRYMNDRLKFCKWLGFDVVDFERVTSNNLLDIIENWKKAVAGLEYPTDGLVISYEDLKEGWALGSTGHHPRWAMALKWTDETAETTIKDIEWSVGKTGVITPVATFEPVRLGLGSTVTRASLHNISIMKNMPVKDGSGKEAMRIGCKAEVYLANLIIPQIASIQNVQGDALDIEVPDRCPICNGKTEIRENNGIKTLHCVNHDNCPAQQIGKLMNTFSKDGLFVKGLGERQLEDLLNAEIISVEPLSIYQIRKNWIAGEEFGCKCNEFIDTKEGWGLKKWSNLMDAIDASRNTTLQRFLYSLNIPLLGNDLSKKIANYMDNDADKFAAWVSLCGQNAESCYSMLMSLDGIGEEKAKNVVGWAVKTASNESKNKAFHDLINELTFPNINTEVSDSSLEGLTFVITGSVTQYKNRDEFKASVEARGGKVAGSVSAKTTALVNNDVTSTSGKNQKAKELGIEIISEDEFINRYGK